MPEKEEYYYDELDEDVKTYARNDIDRLVRGILGLNTGAHSVNRSTIECIIVDLKPVFDKNGRVKKYTDKYMELKRVLLKDIYGKCNPEI